MPGQIELRLGGFAETGNIEFSEHFLQRHTMQPIQVGPGEGAVTHFVHERPVLSAPGIGKSVPVGRHSMDSAKLFAVLNDATAPVDHCAEHIKDQCLHLSNVHPHAPQCAYANSGVVYYTSHPRLRQAEPPSPGAGLNRSMPLDV